MRTGDRLLVRANVVWTAVIWLVFIRNLVRDPSRSTGFRVVHLGIAAVSLAFAAGLWALTVRERRRQAVDS